MQIWPSVTATMVSSRGPEGWAESVDATLEKSMVGMKR